MKIESTHKILKDCIQEMLVIQAKSGTREAVNAVIEMSSLDNSLGPTIKDLQSTAKDSLSTKRKVKRGDQEYKAESEFNQKFESYEVAPF